MTCTVLVCDGDPGVSADSPCAASRRQTITSFRTRPLGAASETQYGSYSLATPARARTEPTGAFSTTSTSLYWTQSSST